MGTPQISEGFVEFDVPKAGKPCQTYYKIFGDLSSGATPVLVVHGGPGLTHHYVLPLAELHQRLDVPVIFYDQIGNGRSTHLEEKMGDESFWVEDLFHDELHNLIAKLGLTTYDLFGHSWGGMMGSTFAGSKPKGMRKLVLSNAPASTKIWDDAYALYRSRLPEDMQTVIQKHEAAGTLDSPEYMEAIFEMNRRHFCNVVPTPEEWIESLGCRISDPTAAFTMHGPIIWSTTGTLREWNAVSAAANIDVPTLVLNGVDEGASDEAIDPFLKGIQNVTRVKLQNSTHMPQFEERENYLKIVSEWLRS